MLLSKEAHAMVQNSINWIRKKRRKELKFMIKALVLATQNAHSTKPKHAEETIHGTCSWFKLTKLNC